MKNMEENKYKNPIMEHYEVDGQMNLSECMQAMQMQRKLTILKGALILREILGVRVNSKEETTRMAQKYTDAELSFWISFLREESHKAADIREKEAEERIQWEVDHDSPQNCIRFMILLQVSMPTNRIGRTTLMLISYLMHTERTRITMTL